MTDTVEVTQADIDAADKAGAIYLAQESAYPAHATVAASIARQAAVDEATRELVEALEATMSTCEALIAFCEKAGVTDDLMAEMFPEQRKRNGQPSHECVKDARRTLNEARQNMATPRAILAKHKEQQP